MSSSDRRPVPLKAEPTRRVMLAAALGAAALAGGCLRPLYAKGTSSTIGGSVRSAMRNIEVAEVKGLVGHNLRNELAFDFDGDNPAPKRLKFQATVTEALEVITVDYNNSRADSAILVATAVWSVTRIGSGKAVSSGTNIARVPYERSTQRFATVRAARDAQLRAGKSLATIIRSQIAADLVAD